MDGQHLLLAHLRDRLRESGAEVPDGWKPADGLPAALGPDGPAAIVVLGDFDPEELVAGAVELSRRLPADAAERWRRSFTKTVFLAGNPRNLASRWEFAHVSSDGRMAWLPPAPPDHYLTLRRLLRLFHGTALPADGARITVPDDEQPCRAPVAHRLSVDVSGLGLEDYLVHVHHAVCEAVIRGTIRGGDEVQLVHRRGVALPSGPCEYARVHLDREDPARLRLYACLERVSPRGEP
jgi:hypothetical protein